RASSQRDHRENHLGCPLPCSGISWCSRGTSGGPAGDPCHRTASAVVRDAPRPRNRTVRTDPTEGDVDLYPREGNLAQLIHSRTRTVLASIFSFLLRDILAMHFGNILKVRVSLGFLLMLYRYRAAGAVS